jgi:hypothetical protein
MRSGRSSSRRQASNPGIVVEDAPPQSQMSVETLTCFLENIKLRNYVGLFDSAFIDFETMLSLNDEDLKELGIKLSSHRATLINACAAYSSKPVPAPKSESKGDQFGWSGRSASPSSSPNPISMRKDREEFGTTERNPNRGELRNQDYQEPRHRAR